ncbi:MAG: hypothetical protein RJB37_705, partial [Pseudomonadota bacterium]
MGHPVGDQALHGITGTGQPVADTLRRRQ